MRLENHEHAAVPLLLMDRLRLLIERACLVLRGVANGLSLLFQLVGIRIGLRPDGTALILQRVSLRIACFGNGAISTIRGLSGLLGRTGAIVGGAGRVRGCLVLIGPSVIVFGLVIEIGVTGPTRWPAAWLLRSGRRTATGWRRSALTDGGRVSARPQTAI